MFLGCLPFHRERKSGPTAFCAPVSGTEAAAIPAAPMVRSDLRLNCMAGSLSRNHLERVLNHGKGTWVVPLARSGFTTS